MNKRFFCFLLVLVICGCVQTDHSEKNNSARQAETLTISAAISLKDAFDEIGAAFEKKTGTKINFNYGASGALQQQIENGAPADVFASSGERQMDALEKGGFIETDSRRDFARNSLVLIAAKDSKLTIQSFEDLAKDEIKKIAVGNPKTVPAGQYAEESLTKMNLQNSLQAKLILAENVRQVLDYVSRGETDAGIVYATDATAAKSDVKIAATADENTHSPILYPIAVVKNGKQKAAREFTDFVLSAEGQKILQKYGFRAF